MEFRNLKSIKIEGLKKEGFSKSFTQQNNKINYYRSRSPKLNPLENKSSSEQQQSQDILFQNNSMQDLRNVQIENQLKSKPKNQNQEKFITDIQITKFQQQNNVKRKSQEGLNIQQNQMSFTRYLLDSCIEDIKEDSQGEDLSKRGSGQNFNKGGGGLRINVNNSIKHVPYSLEGYKRNKFLLPNLLDEDLRKSFQSRMNQSKSEDKLIRGERKEILEQRELQMEINEILFELKQLGSYKENGESMISNKMMSLLEKISQIKGSFQDTIKYVKNLIEEIVFCSDEKIYKKILQTFGFQFPKKINNSFRHVTEVILENIDSITEKHTKQQNIFIAQIQNQKQVIDNKNLQIEQLKKQIIELNEQNLTQQKSIDVKIQQITSELKQENSQLKQILSFDQQTLKKQKIDFSTDKGIMEQDFHNTILQISKDKIELEKQTKDQQLRIDHLKNLVERQQEKNEMSFAALIVSKDRIKELEDKVKQLFTQNEKLGARANLQIENMTPRPSFSELLPYLQEIPKDFSESHTKRKIEIIGDSINIQLKELNFQILQKNDQIYEQEDQMKEYQNQISNISINQRTSMDNFEEHLFQQENSRQPSKIEQKNDFQ